MSDDKPTRQEGSAAARAEERRARDEQLVAAVAKGDAKAFGKLVDAWFDEVYDYASSRGATGDALTDVARQTFETTWKALQSGNTKPTLAATIMQAARTALGPTKKRKASGAGAEEKLSRATDPAAVVRDAGVAALLWDAASVLGDRVRDVLDLHYRHGLTTEEIGAVTGMPTDKARELLSKIPNGYANAIRARVLWKGGEPEHDVLREELANSGADGFDDKAVRAIHAHTRTCDQCRARALVALAPIEVFSDLPIAVAPTGLKEKAVIALASAGLNVTGSAFYVEAKVATTDEGSGRSDAEDWRERAKASAEAATQAVVAEASQRAARALAKEGAATDPSSAVKDSAAAPAKASTEQPTATSTTVPKAQVTPGGKGQPSNKPSIGESPSTPPPQTAGESEPGVSKRWIGIAAAAAVLVLIIIVVALTRSGGDKTEVSASGETTTTTSTARPVSTTAGVGTTAATTSVDESSTTTTVSSTTVTTPVGGLSSTTTAVLTTTTTIPLSVNANLAMVGGTQPNRRTVNYSMVDAPSLTWSVSANKPVNVVVKDYNGNVVSVEPNGTIPSLCPGPTTPDNKCGAPVGQYSWNLLVATPTGQTVAAQTQTLRITP
ncbi:MAG: hypothetical protein N2037_11170 [Acidimicrobiales bacterium]|nr:hypothetical protein [Acidimicrobiales bacterium]